MPASDAQPDTGGLPRFPLGRLVATPAALTALVVAKVSPWALLARHAQADWGDLNEHDRAENERALTEGNRLLSVYTLADHSTVWIITEADRSVSTLLLPEDY